MTPDPSREIEREQVVADLAVVVSRMHLNYSDRFELDAEQFYCETGFMAPGKSMPMEMHTSVLQERREEAWEKWTTERSAKHQQLLRDCLALLTAASPVSPDVRKWLRHDRLCLKLHCQLLFCGAYERDHGGSCLYRHAFVAGACDCGLDAALASSPVSPDVSQATAPQEPVKRLAGVICWKCGERAPRGESCPKCGAYNSEGK